MNRPRSFIAGAKPDPDISGQGQWRTNMGEVIRFVSRAELERMRLSRESRARNPGLLPPAASSEQRDAKGELADS